MRLNRLNLRSKILLVLVLLASFLPAAISVHSAEERSDLIPAFTNFPFDYNVLPDDFLQAIKSPQNDLRKIAASFMERKRLFVTRWDDPTLNIGDPNFPQSASEVEVICIFPEQYLDSLFEKGQLNLHQVGHSRGVCEPAIRAQAEDFMIGIHLESKYNPDPSSRVQALRPKYGCVNFLKPCGIKVNPFRLLQYGQVLIVYNDEVKKRTSFTFGDSLASYCEPWAITLHPLDPHPLTMLHPPGPKESSMCRYVEAQIWGPIELSDIKEFRIPAERKDLLEKLSKSGKPVFSYDRSKMEENDSFIDVSDCGWQRGTAMNQAAVDLLKKESIAHK